MKTAVSIPDAVFARAEALAKSRGTSRSGLYSQAIAEYVDRHSADAVTEAMDGVLLLLDEGVDPFVVEASRRILSANEW